MMSANACIPIYLHCVVFVCLLLCFLFSFLFTFFVDICPVCNVSITTQTFLRLRMLRFYISYVCVTSLLHVIPYIRQVFCFDQLLSNTYQIETVLVKMESEIKRIHGINCIYIHSTLCF